MFGVGGFASSNLVPLAKISEFSLLFLNLSGEVSFGCCEGLLLVAQYSVFRPQCGVFRVQCIVLLEKEIALDWQIQMQLSDRSIDCLAGVSARGYAINLAIAPLDTRKV